MNVVLISTYEMGRQPFGIASPASWLADRDNVDVFCVDLAVEHLPKDTIRRADVIGIYLPMHTATKLAVSLVPRFRKLNPRAHLCFYGLYASMNEELLLELGASGVFGGEFEESLSQFVFGLLEAGSGSEAQEPARVLSLNRQRFMVPDRTGLPPLRRYARLNVGGEQRVVGYTEASRGCRHLCRHCPIVPVYKGRFRIVQREVVLQDIAQQVAAGAQHITFGDPDFFNGPEHSLAIVRALHERYPSLTYDVTIKVEHLLRHRDRLPELRATGCLFVTSAVESIDDEILNILDKGHTREDFFEIVRTLRSVRLAFNPTFVAFTPWTTLDRFLELLATIADLELVENVAPVQYTIRLLIPAGSRLLELPSVQRLVGPFDPTLLSHPWTHPDPAVDSLQASLLRLVSQEQGNASRRELFEMIWNTAAATRQEEATRQVLAHVRAVEGERSPVPFLTEPWY